MMKRHETRQGPTRNKSGKTTKVSIPSFHSRDGCEFPPEGSHVAYSTEWDRCVAVSSTDKCARENVVVVRNNFRSVFPDDFPRVFYAADVLTCPEDKAFAAAGDAKFPPDPAGFVAGTQTARYIRECGNENILYEEFPRRQT